MTVMMIPMYLGEMMMHLAWQRCRLLLGTEMTYNNETTDKIGREMMKNKLDGLTRRLEEIVRQKVTE